VKLLLKRAAAILALFTIVPIYAQSQKQLDILVEAFEGNKPAKDVTFQLVRGQKEVVKETSKRGYFNFIVEEKDPTFQLVISKSGYLTKRIYFDPKEFPFEADYETQEIGIECVPISTNMKGVEYVGKMSFDNVGKSYSIAKVDSSTIKLKRQLQQKEEQIEAIYTKAIYNGEGLIKIEEYEYAKGYFEMALVAKPTDTYAKQQFEFADSMAIIEAIKPPPLIVQIEGSTQRVKTTTSEKVTETIVEPKKESQIITQVEGSYYSVQLGAFVDWYNEEVFAEVPELLVVQGSDYKRCISGQFETRDEALSRAQEMKQKGFKDAFVVHMKGNQRIGF
jgi:hypothetical protein